MHDEVGNDVVPALHLDTMILFFAKEIKPGDAAGTSSRVGSIGQDYESGGGAFWKIAHNPSL